MSRMSGGYKDRERTRERDRRYRDERHGKESHQSTRRSPECHSSEEEAFDEGRRRPGYEAPDSRRSRREGGYGRERSRSSDRERDRDRYRDRERPRDRAYDSFSGETGDQYDYNEEMGNEGDRDRHYHSRREETPNNTIMIRGLAPNVTENDVISKLSDHGLVAKDIRLMRKKETGASRGFAFVEMNTIPEAVQWKELTQGFVDFEHCQASLHFSVPKDSFSAERGVVQKYDWTCYKCGVNNFKRREQCFKCGTPREESAANETGDEISPTPTNCLILRNMSVNTTEERILTVLNTITAMPIKSIRIPKDTASTSTKSRGVCFVELHTTLEASQLFTLLSSLNNGFIVDEASVSINYAKRNGPAAHLNSNAVNAASIALAAAHWSNQSEQSSDPSPQSNYQPITGFQSVAGASGKPSSFSSLSTKGTAGYGTGKTVTVNGVPYQKYPVPDISSYQFDETSGYYYDSSTTLYYDSTSHYYYNSSTQQYLYWTPEHETYVPVETKASAPTTEPTERTNQPVDEKVKEKQDKVKIAKKIAKDMEKWAKTLNQRKETAKSQIIFSSINSESLPEDCSTSHSFLPVSEPLIPGSMEPFTLPDKKCIVDKKLGVEQEVVVKKELLASEEGLCPENESDDSLRRSSPGPIEAAAIIQAEELRLTDWDKLLCLLCKRQFSSKDQLLKHQQVSELHKSNLVILRKSRLTEEQNEELERKEREDAGYRDRAKERRKKYGIPESVEPNKLKDKYLREVADESVKVKASSSSAKLGGNNIGNKMLKAMGWSEGQGLGRANQGRSEIIEVERRIGCAGLGTRAAIAPVAAGETYKDAVRRAMAQRFKEIQDQN